MSNFEAQFKKLGKAISANAERLAELVSYAGEEVYFDKVPGSFAELSHLDIVLGNVAEGFSASSLLMQLSHTIGRGDANRKFAPGVEEWLSTVQLRIDQYNNAIVDGAEENRIRRLHDIRELVFQMREGLLNEVRSMEMALNTRFGHVESIKDKYIENKYLIDYLSRLTGKLAVLDYKKLNSLAGANSDLRRLLAQRLYDTVTDCRENIMLALPRLRHLLWEIEKQNKQAKRIWAMHNYFKAGSSTLTYEPSDEELIELRIGCPVTRGEYSLSPDIYEQQNVDTLAEVVATLKPRKDTTDPVVDLGSTSSFEGSAIGHESVEAENEVKQHLSNLLRETKHGHVSVLDYWQREMRHQKYPSGFMMLAHLNYRKIPQLKLTEHYLPATDFDAAKRLKDFTVERA